jgi:hypothetical protein
VGWLRRPCRKLEQRRLIELAHGERDHVCAVYAAERDIKSVAPADSTLTACSTCSSGHHATHKTERRGRGKNYLNRRAHRRERCS